MSTGAEPQETPVVPPSPGFPSTVLALVERGQADDGVAYVGLLLERALAELAPTARTLTVFPDSEGSGDPTIVQRNLFRARLLAAGRKADCVVFNHLGVATAQAGIPSRMRRPYAVFVHGREALDEQLDAPRRRALTEARVLIANSEFTARRLAEMHPELQPAEVCHLALLPERPEGTVDGALVSSITPRTIVIAGRMTSGEQFKGHDELLDAWPAVLARRPDARLVLVGRGDDAKRLEAKANRLGVITSVRFTGFVSEATLDAMLARSGGFALPSQANGFGLSYLRAMRAGVPCIAGTEDAGPEVVEHGVTGLLVPPSDRDAIAQAVIDLLGDSQRRRAMGEAGRARFLSEFSFERFRERLEGLIRGGFARS